MAGITLMLLPEAEVNKKAFLLLKTVLHMLDKGHSALSPVMLYKIRLLDIAGYCPSLKCIRCKREGEGFYTEGSIICSVCVSRNPLFLGLTPVSPASIKLYESLRLWDIQKVMRIKPSDSMLSELKMLVDAHMQYIAPQS